MAATPEQIDALEILEQAKSEYLTALEKISLSIVTQKQNIVDAEAAIQQDQAQLDALAGDESDQAAAQRAELEANIIENTSVIAANTNARDTNEARFSETENLLNENDAEQQSIREAIDGPGPTPAEVSETTTTQQQTDNEQVQNTGPTPVTQDNAFETQQAAQAAEDAQAAAVTAAANQENPYESQLARDAADNAQVLSDGSEAGVQEQINILKAQEQATLQARQNQPSSADWRVRLQLATGADYLYKAKSAGILQPLAATDGVVFPYTPSIETTYQAKYNQNDLTHSNYRGYFYQSSYIDHVNVRGVFTAQDTREASYLLAVIHFFRSVTKMFYGKDAQAGSPPPLVYLSGLGQYQFNKHPCVVSNFTYSLPSDVDYIRANGFNNIGIDLLNRSDQSSGPAFNGVLGGFLSSKLGINGLSLGGIRKVPSPSPVNQNVNTTNSTNSTYVPTKMEISITLLPIQTRNQVSKQFSLENFANGNLLKGGFW